ncbi:hypothetical protein NA56DRAFT_747032 [Hyaloscypha hepaticicola]|uniref:Uncharacterized protein n=1 Tax=Hyaloscypha hepaticicola TaxID=2082293 RepID=A0A2J6QAA1_9HELO|nr:hypothetical protein NA56DRAFT_747032 [Hyaloscypha hepaticicola]
MLKGGGRMHIDLHVNDYPRLIWPAYFQSGECSTKTSNFSSKDRQQKSIRGLMVVVPFIFQLLAQHFILLFYPTNPHEHWQSNLEY